MPHWDKAAFRELRDVSNQEADPQETVSDPGTPPALGPIEVLEPRDVPLGGIRAMNVRRTLPQRKRSLIGAWCFLDHYGPDRVGDTGGMNVAAHPHVGLQTVSWLFAGQIEHRDSAGSHALVRPGELNLMTAGRGISHSERSTADTTILHGVQLWVALPKRNSRTGKRFETFVPPVISGPGWAAQVFLGSLLGETSPVATYSPLLGAELNLEPKAELSFQVQPGFEHGVLVDQGSVVLTASSDAEQAAAAGETHEALSTKVPKDRLAYVPPGAGKLRIRAGSDGAKLLALGGQPLGGRIVMWWNFVGQSHDEIVQARKDWQAQIAPAGVPDPRDYHPGSSSAAPNRFGLPADEPEPPLPAPPLPNARLRPRG